MKKFFLLPLLAILYCFAPSSADAAACVTNAFAKAAGNFSNTTTVWVTTSGGSTACTLTAGNNAIFDANTGAGTYVVDESISLATFDASAAAAGITITHNAFTLTITGATINIPASVTYNASGSTSAWSLTNTSTTTITTGGHTFGNMTLNGVGLVATFSGAVNLRSDSTMTLTNGTADMATNNPAVSVGAFSSNNTNTRVVKMGTGGWTITGVTGSVFDLSTANTGLTCNTCNSSSLTFSATAATAARTFNGGGGQHFGNVTIAPQATNNNTVYQFAIVNSTGTFDQFTLTGGTFVTFPSNATLNITTIAVTGTSAQPNTLSVANIAAVLPATLAITNNASPTWTAFYGIKTTTGTIAASKSFDLGQNQASGTTLTISAPSGGGVFGQ